jgi:hypothetical protein
MAEPEESNAIGWMPISRYSILDAGLWCQVSGVRKGWKNNSGIQGKGYKVQGSGFRVQGSGRKKYALYLISCTLYLVIGTQKRTGAMTYKFTEEQLMIQFMVRNQ